MNDRLNPNSELEQSIVSVPDLAQVPEEFLNMAQQFQEAMMMYTCAIREVKTKIEVLNDELSVRNSRNPIEMIKSRVKKPRSIVEKLRRRGLEVSLESMIANLDDVAGIRFRVNLTARYGHRVTVYENEQGEPFDPQKSYTVVLNSFRARDLQQMGVRIDTVAADYRLALARWLVQHPELRPRARDNWSAGPERWVRSIAERERRIIFER